MKKLLKKKISCLLWVVALIILSMGLHDVSYAASDNSSNYITEKELEKYLSSKEIPTKQELLQEVINTQKSRIGVLEGNINSLLALLGVLVGIFTLAGALFGFYVRNMVLTQIEKMNELTKKVSLDKNEIEKVHLNSVDIENSLKRSDYRMDKLLIELEDKIELYKQSSVEIEEIKNKLIQHNHLFNRNEELIKFILAQPQNKEIIKKLSLYCEEIWINDKELQDEFIKEFGLVTESGSVTEAITYYISNIRDVEEDIRIESRFKIELEDIDNDGDLHDDVISRIEDWKYLNTILFKMNGLIENYHQHAA
ncbi:hypothetical protein [Paenibacillus sp. Y412MC10]|uniref:hypothetical protein n=1 Tax=Geobacillus sp. (strain Y412MC10) TaxID=481743 RepID=UPI0011AB31FD|nr:hypothetical protein [Paenibacillus sp. Y412MC10]